MVVDAKYFKDPIGYTPGLEGILVKALPPYGMEPARCIEPYTTTLVPKFFTPDGSVPDWLSLNAD